MVLEEVVVVGGRGGVSAVVRSQLLLLEGAGVQVGAPAELSVANAAAAAAALVAAAASSDVSVDGDSARLCPFEDTAVTDDNDGVDAALAASLTSE